MQVLWLDAERISSDVSSNLAAGLSKQLAQQTSPHSSFATEVRKNRKIPFIISKQTTRKKTLEAFFYVFVFFQGLLRIHLLAGQNLIPKDNLMGGMVKGKSDPYVKINIGGETFTSQVIKSNLNPTWNEMYEVNMSELFVLLTFSLVKSVLLNV